MILEDEVVQKEETQALNTGRTVTIQSGKLIIKVVSWMPETLELEVLCNLVHSQKQGLHRKTSQRPVVQNLGEDASCSPLFCRWKGVNRVYLQRLR